LKHFPPKLEIALCEAFNWVLFYYSSLSGEKEIFSDLGELCSCNFRGKERRKKWESEVAIKLWKERKLFGVSGSDFHTEILLHLLPFSLLLFFETEKIHAKWKGRLFVLSFNWGSREVNGILLASFN
jgi:hypothetical protein